MLGYVVWDNLLNGVCSLFVLLIKQGLRFRKDMEELTDEVHQALFSEFSNEEITQYYQLSIKLMHGIDHLEVFFKNRQKGAEGWLK